MTRPAPSRPGRRRPMPAGRTPGWVRAESPSRWVVSASSRTPSAPIARPLAGGGFSILHILFNMYALYLFGPVIEELYGHVEYLAIYLLCALGGGVLTIVAMPGSPVLGASGAIFGLSGVGFTVWRRRHLVLSPRSRMILSQMGPLLVINLVFTFAVPGISWTGHI